MPPGSTLGTCDAVHRGVGPHGVVRPGRFQAVLRSRREGTGHPLRARTPPPTALGCRGRWCAAHESPSDQAAMTFRSEPRSWRGIRPPPGEAPALARIACSLISGRGAQAPSVVTAARMNTATGPEGLRDGAAEQRPDGHRAPGEEPIAGVDATEQVIGRDALSERDRDDIPHRARGPSPRGS